MEQRQLISYQEAKYFTRFPDFFVQQTHVKTLITQHSNRISDLAANMEQKLSQEAKYFSLDSYNSLTRSNNPIFLRQTESKMRQQMEMLLTRRSDKR